MSTKAVGVAGNMFPSGILNIERGLQSGSREQLLRYALRSEYLNPALMEFLEYYGVRNFQYMEALGHVEWMPVDLHCAYLAHVWIWGYVPTGFLLPPKCGYPEMRWTTSGNELDSALGFNSSDVWEKIGNDLDHLLKRRAFGSSAQATAQAS